MTKEKILAMEPEQLNELVAGEIMHECYHQHTWSKTLPEAICKAALLTKKETDNHGQV